MQKTNEIFKERLTALVKATRKSERQVAIAAQVDPRNFNNYCRGRIPKDERDLDKIATYLGSTRAYLLGFTDNPSPQSAGRLYKTLTAPSNNGPDNKEAHMVDADLYRSLLRIGNEMAALRQDVRDLTDRIVALETRGGTRPTKGRKAR